MARIGILALQGDFDAHAAVLRAIGHEPCLVREPTDLRDLAGLVLPGGESTAQLRLLDKYGLGTALAEFGQQQKPVLATCAGLILAASRVIEPAQRSLGWIDVTVARNNWGRQVHSFEAQSDDGLHPLVFIRAPRLVALGPDVQVLATLAGEPILIRQGVIVGAAFHPELTADRSIHQDVFRGCG